MEQTDPTAADVALWLKRMSRKQLHNDGWIMVNQRFHGIARAARPFLQAHFSDETEQEAAFDGFTLALLTIAHFADIARITELFGTSDDIEADEQPI